MFENNKTLEEQKGKHNKENQTKDAYLVESITKKNKENQTKKPGELVEKQNTGSTAKKTKKRNKIPA